MKFFTLLQWEHAEFSNIHAPCFNVNQFIVFIVINIKYLNKRKCKKLNKKSKNFKTSTLHGKIFFMILVYSGFFYYYFTMIYEIFHLILSNIFNGLYKFISLILVKQNQCDQVKILQVSLCKIFCFYLFNSFKFSCYRHIF